MTTITLWPWDDAPADLKVYSKHGGDEDWLAILDGDFDALPWRLQDVFNVGLLDEDAYRWYIEGWGHVQRETLPDGRVLAIGAHA